MDEAGSWYWKRQEATKHYFYFDALLFFFVLVVLYGFFVFVAVPGNQSFDQKLNPWTWKPAESCTALPGYLSCQLGPFGDLDRDGRLDCSWDTLDSMCRPLEGLACASDARCAGFKCSLACPQLETGCIEGACQCRCK